VRPVLLDTGVIVGWLDRSEQYHQDCVAAVQGLDGQLITCEAVLAESCYLLRAVSAAPQAVLDNVERGIFQVPFQLSRSAPAVKRVMAKYRDLRIDFADACLVCLAEEMGTGEILTLDRGFQVFRWGRHSPFRLLVSLD